MPSPWMTPEQERRLRKWTNWSGHFAWGGFLVFVLNLWWPHFVAVGVSGVIGALWEVLYWALTNKGEPANRASLIDCTFWLEGSIYAGLLIVYFG